MDSITENFDVLFHLLWSVDPERGSRIEKEEKNEKERWHSYTESMILTEIKQNFTLLACRATRLLPVLTLMIDGRKETLRFIQFASSLSKCRFECIAFNKLNRIEDIPTRICSPRNLLWIRIAGYSGEKNRRNQRSMTFELLRVLTFIDTFFSTNIWCVKERSIGVVLLRNRNSNCLTF